MRAVMSGYDLFWVDCEMTGLDTDNDVLLEVACVVTDKSLQHRLDGPSVVIHQPKARLEAMGEWCRDHHMSSGLWRESLESQFSHLDAQNQIIKFLSGLDDRKVNWILAGNSVHHDKSFLMKWMPQLMSMCHYQIVDVTSIGIVLSSWYELSTPDKKQTHRAVDDIHESIDQLAYYRQFIANLSA